MAKKYFNLNELLEMIDEPNRSCCKNIYLDNKDMFERAKGSNVKHQAWEGGYLDHLRDIMNISIVMYETFSEYRDYPFSLSDTLLVLYLHDLEKPWKYAGSSEQKKEVQSYPDYQDFIKSKIEQYSFNLTDEHWNALKYIHGEGKDCDPLKNVQGPLAAFVHCCDTKSGRIWSDLPKDEKW